MNTFTLGLIFNSTMDKVLLMHKNRPDWQRGRVNGVGGTIEPNETSAACIVREVEEETTLATSEVDWKFVANLSGHHWSMDVYALVHKGSENDITTCTDERVEWFDVVDLPENILSNLSWLVPLAIDKMKDNTLEPINARYS